MVNRRDLFGAGLDFETLKSNARGGDSSLRWAAAIELGELGTEEAALLLWDMRSDGDENVRNAVQTALSRFDRSILASALNGAEASQAAQRPAYVSESDLDEQGLLPFRAWKVRPLEAPSADNEWAVASAINDIVSTEGPLNGTRLLKLYGQAVSPNAPKKINKFRVKKGIENLLARGILSRADTVNADAIDEWIIHRTGEPDVVIRQQGQRLFAEIPVNEVRELIKTKVGFASNPSSDRKFRVVMDAYGIQARDFHLIGALFEKEWAELL